MIMSSCTNNELDFGSSDAGSKLQVSASIHEMTSRAHDTSWEANDAIGVSDDGTNTNVKYVTNSGDGVFSSDQTIYLLGDENHSFTAYYPYSETVTADNKVITFTQPADYMYGTATATRQSPNAAFTFTHKMSELSFTVKDASSTTSSAKASASTRSSEGEDASSSTTTTSTITLHNVILDGNFNTSTGTVTAGTSKSDYTVNFTLGEKTSIILPPQTFTDNKVEITVTNNGKTYGGTLSLEKSEESKDIQYQLTINKENESKALNISSSTITGWTAIDKGNQNLEEKEAENVLEVGDFLLSDGTVVDKAYDLTKLTDTDKKVVGVVYYVGNAQPSVLYSIDEGKDILKAEYSDATNGLAIAISNANEEAAAVTTEDFNYSNLIKSGQDIYNETLAAKYFDKTLNWSTNNLACTTYMVGYNNTSLMEAYSETDAGKTKDPAATTVSMLKTYRENNKVTNASAWYIPSYTEFKAIIDNYATISASITKAGGSLPQYGFENKKPTSFYWTSDMRGSQYNWVTTLTSDDLATDENSKGTNTLYLSRKNSKGYFRLAVAF